ncbi:MAG: hypothetical protein PHD51_03325 [Patescibacteria group bacterium]|nr:hypothetical protein [Patescibacteria group bacterium]MDD5490990.1 hypothetical protein [Patescibacteria group bacterium]
MGAKKPKNPKTVLMVEDYVEIIRKMERKGELKHRGFIPWQSNPWKKNNRRHKSH